ncbi:MAG TPA: hypothetical protein VFZ61_23370 [Polyangiales bacterium]
MDRSKWTWIAAVWSSITWVGCAAQDPELQARQEALEGEGFASPIPLPAFADIDEDRCVEQILRTGRDRTLQFNGHPVVDLGIFHVHEDVEHTNAAERCFSCPGLETEGHIVVGQETCRRSVVQRPWPDTEQGRKDRADALLGECGEAVVSMGVCLDRGSRRTALDLGRVWSEANQQLMCINLGGPTGSHSPHPAFVQWLHLREYCPRLAGNASLHTSSYEPGKLHIGLAAEIVEAELQDSPRCGAMTDRKCRECGSRHARCCRSSDYGYDANTQGCDEGLHCEGPEGWRRCLPTGG